MAWGPGGEEIREAARVDLAMIKQRVYTLTCTVRDLKHVEKGPRLRALATQLSDTLEQIEKELNR